MAAEFFRSRGDEVLYLGSDLVHIGKHVRTAKEGMRLIRTLVYRRNISIRRLLSHYCFSRDALRIMKEEPEADLLWLSVPHNCNAAIGPEYKKMFPNARMIVDITDLWPETMPLPGTGKWPFTLWSGIHYILYPIFWKKRYDTETSLLYMAILAYMTVTYLTDNTALYFSCDVGKFLDRQKGVADLNNFDYQSLLGVSFGMDKRERILTHASGSTHAMTLIAVDIKDGKPSKWMVENSWGASSGYKGNIIMTDEWFDEYMFRLVVEKKYVPADVLSMMAQKPILLPSWDPMFMPEE